MKTYQVEINETLCMTVEIEAENAQQAEAIVREAYNNEVYILDAEHFAGVEFTTQEKKIEARSRNQKCCEYER
ncbi:MAG: DpnD/PcfM family protein [Bacillota bacterium]